MITKPTDLPPDFSSASLLADANRCVACGLCLPHCPTYRITLSEADSPRGRIALISGVASGRIPVNARFALHMGRCLTCRACEAVCPNHVAYGHLVDGARAIITQSSSTLPGQDAGMKKSALRALVEKEFIAKPTRLDALRPLLRLYQTSGLQAWVQKSGLLGKTKFAVLEAQLPLIDIPCSTSNKTATSWQVIYPASSNSRGEVGLFLGCVARLADAATLNAAIFVLNRLGYTVHVPPAQTCCGALHRHGGDMQTSVQLARENMAAFAGLNLHAIISTASGCGVQLAEAPFGFPAEVIDISAFLEKAEGWSDVKISPLRRKITVHEPCSLRNVLRGAAQPYALLARIPDARIAPLAGNDQCCGAAGTYFLDQPEMAKALLDDKMIAVDKSEGHYLATSNVGCALHMASALRQAGSKIEVLHPVTLLARQMGMPF
ncbi:MAG: (Fe-S)-binding protein [Nitrosomonadaceae bacterium]|nr:(Fe-S)-binding protein [Nitrosomonadaceae bacterium]